MIHDPGLRGRLFTLDARPCQKTLKAAVDSGNDMLVRLKATSPNCCTRFPSKAGPAMFITAINSANASQRVENQVGVAGGSGRCGPIVEQHPLPGPGPASHRAVRLRECGMVGAHRDGMVCRELRAQAAAQAVSIIG